MKSLPILPVICSMAYMTAAQECELPIGSSVWNEVTVTEDIKAPVAFGLTEKGDAFIAEMLSGHIKLHEAATGKTVDLGKVHPDLYTDAGGVVENGLLGVAPDPDYYDNHWVYAFYSRQMSEKNTTDCRQTNVMDHKHFLVRFTVAGNQLSRPKELLSFQRWSTSHAAGAIVFDKNGDLFIATGDDTNPKCHNGSYGPRGSQLGSGCRGRPVGDITGVDAQQSSANTNDLRGKLLRIRPIAFSDSENPPEGPNSTYTIPEGNLFDEKLDVGGKTRPEIYTMGHRNPYHFRIDPVTGWIMIGEVGPDAGSDRGPEPRGHDEFNLVKKPGNFGWPYVNADNQAYAVQSSLEGDYEVGTFFDPDNLQNKSPRNTGLTDLPPAIRPLGWYSASGSQKGASEAFGEGGETAIGGPRIWYDESKPEGKLPAYFQGKFVVGDWSRAKLWVLDVDSSGSLRKIEPFRSDDAGNLVKETSSAIDIDVGPEGALHVLYTGGIGYGNWKGNGKLVRFEYTGAYYGAESCGDKIVQMPASVSIAGKSGKSGRESFRLLALNFPRTGMMQVAVPIGAISVSLHDIRGNFIWASRISGRRFAIPRRFAKQNLLIARFGFD